MRLIPVCQKRKHSICFYDRKVYLQFIILFSLYLGFQVPSCPLRIGNKKQNSNLKRKEDFQQNVKTIFNQVKTSYNTLIPKHLCIIGASKSGINSWNLNLKHKISGHHIQGKPIVLRYKYYNYIQSVEYKFLKISLQQNNFELQFDQSQRALPRNWNKQLLISPCNYSTILIIQI